MGFLLFPLEIFIFTQIDRTHHFSVMGPQIDEGEFI
jgi:hypothetical protein